MLYVKEISTPITTYATSPKTTKLRIWKGVIHKIDVLIPAGHAGLAKLQIFIGGHIIMPTNEDGYISGDDTTVPGKFFIDLERDISTAIIKTWNTDDTFAHTFIVRISVLPRWILIPQIMVTKAIEGLVGLFR